MAIKSKQLFILIGDVKTGKTTLQKLLIEKFCGQVYAKLPTNLIFDISHLEIKRKYQHISFGNRSYQEKKADYISVDNYFTNHFKSADIAFISSHLVQDDIQEMIGNAHKRFYNVTGIFWTNSISNNQNSNSQISSLNWDERLIIENPTSEDNNTIEKQLNEIADSLVFFIANRTHVS